MSKIGSLKRHKINKLTVKLTRDLKKYKSQVMLGMKKKDVKLQMPQILRC